MARRPEISPRRVPQQERARVTVDAIVQATADVLRKQGYAGATLRRIAERAGVGVGSIYQYFPTKAALLAAVVESHLHQMTALVSAQIADAAPDLPGVVRAMVAGVVAAHQQDAALHRVIVDEFPRVAGLDLHRQTLAAMEAQVTALLEAYTATVRPGARPLQAAILVSAVDAAVHTVVLERPALAELPIVDELTRLVLAYLDVEDGFITPDTGAPQTDASKESTD